MCSSLPPPRFCFIYKKKKKAKRRVAQRVGYVMPVKSKVFFLSLFFSTLNFVFLSIGDERENHSFSHYEKRKKKKKMVQKRNTNNNHKKKKEMYFFPSFFPLSFFFFLNYTSRKKKRRKKRVRCAYAGAVLLRAFGCVCVVSSLSFFYSPRYAAKSTGSSQI